ncbi:MAG: CoA pyrophosphatase [Anaerolineae bacterium]|nr:CoA pyrophosphatase [Anaerolineae bacterium]
MAPPQRQLYPSNGSTPRQSAVLMLLYPTQAGVTLLYTLRTTTLSHHRGEISFPGGGSEPGDCTLIDTALREAEEEVNLPTNKVTILGAITPLYIQHSQNLVHPFIGWIAKLPPLYPNAAEVAQILEIPVCKLLMPEAIGYYEWHRNGQLLRAPSYIIDGFIIWGATAMMTSEFLTIITRMKEQK